MLLATFAVAAAVPARAAWPPVTSDLPVCTQTGAQNYRAVVPDGAGGMFVSWSDTRFIVSDIYVQHVTAAGTLQYVSSGLSVCSASGRQESPICQPDGIGGLTTVWRDYRFSQDGDLYAQRVDASGSLVWAFNGIKICGASGPQSAPAIVSDVSPDSTGAFGSFIIWSDERDTPTIYAQHVRPNGTTLWAGDGVPIVAPSAAQFSPSAIADGNGGAILTWTQQGSDGWDVWAQRIAADGSPLWGAAGVRLCGAPGDQYAPVLVTDDAQGAWFAWQDDRDVAVAVYVQHVDAAGTPQLAADGVRICVQANDQVAPALAQDTGNGVYVAWTDSRTGTDLYAQHLDASGALQWDAGGVAACAGSGTHAFASAVPDGSGGVILAWEDTRNGGSDVFAQRLQSNGSALWAVGGAAVSTASSNQYQVSAVPDGTGGAVMLWTDTRGGTVDLYAERIPVPGSAPAELAPRALSAQPNPARESATFAFELGTPGRGELTVFDAAGRRVRTVARQDLSAGDHRIAWDARDDAGRRCSEGVYFARLALDGRTIATRTLAIMR
jgi:hypothetical protein